MLSSQIPVKFGIPFANGAQPGFITTPIPTPSQPNGRASLTDGFSQLNFDPTASGGIPPWGKDFNGLLYQVTAWLQWAAAGGFPVSYDSTFAALIGGYPQWATLKTAAGDRYWISSVDNNLSNPDTGGAGWIAFPDVIVQKQAGNYAVDTGGVNAYAITLTPAVTDWSKIVGSPLRFLSGNANTVNNPTISVNGLSGKTMINSDGTALSVPQISRAGQICEGFYDGTFFQLTNPVKAAAGGGAGGPFIPGMIFLWGAETAPTGTLECNGAQYNIVTYPQLFIAIGNRFGGDGINNFKVPDLRGAFVRGWDHGRGLDPSSSTRTSAPQGGGSVVGDHVGSWEKESVNMSDISGSTLILHGVPANPFPPNDQNPDHWRPLQAYEFDPFLSASAWVDLTVIGRATGQLTGIGDTIGQGFNDPAAIQGIADFSGNVGPETRPINIDLMYVIAY